MNPPAGAERAPAVVGPGGWIHRDGCSSPSIFGFRSSADDGFAKFEVMTHVAQKASVSV